MQTQLVRHNLIRDGLGVPVFVVNSELEAMSCYGVRQPDTDTFRYWEAAGTCRLSRQVQQTHQALQKRDQIIGGPMEPDIDVATGLHTFYDLPCYYANRAQRSSVEIQRCHSI